MQKNPQKHACIHRLIWQSFNHDKQVWQCDTCHLEKKTWLISKGVPIKLEVILESTSWRRFYLELCEHPMFGDPSFIWLEQLCMQQVTLWNELHKPCFWKWYHLCNFLEHHGILTDTDALSPMHSERKQKQLKHFILTCTSFVIISVHYIWNKCINLLLPYYCKYNFTCM